MRAASSRSLGLALAASLLMLAAGCSPASRPYRFSSPLLGGADLPDGYRGSGEERATPDQPPERRPRRDSSKRAAVAMQEIRGPSRSRRGEALPPRATLPADADPQDPRSWVGARDDSDPVLAVLSLCKRRHERCPETGPSRSQWQPPETAFGVGDLLLFERVGLDNKESLVALVTARQARGVYELAYLAAGVWRRGLIDPARPRLHKDKEGRIVNTFLRHRRALPPSGTRFLAGELLVGVIRLKDYERQPPQVAAK